MYNFKDQDEVIYDVTEIDQIPVEQEVNAIPARQHNNVIDMIRYHLPDDTELNIITKC